MTNPLKLSKKNLKAFNRQVSHTFNCCEVEVLIRPSAELNDSLEFRVIGPSFKNMTDSRSQQTLVNFLNNQGITKSSTIWTGISDGHLAFFITLTKD